MNAIKSLLMGCLLAAAALYGPPVLSAPETGWWWNPAESGRGFFIESQDGIFFLGGYFYDDDGHARWLVAGGGNADPYLTRTAVRAERRPVAVRHLLDAIGAGRCWNGTVAFSDDTHGTITWPGGTIAMERYSFGTGTPDFRPFTGWWWNPAESGSGYSVELQGDTFFVVGYMYETMTAAPFGTSRPARLTTPMHYEGPWLRYSGGQMMTGPYHAPNAPQTVGTRSVDFIQADTATLTFSRTMGASLPELAHQGRRDIAARYPDPTRIRAHVRCLAAIRCKVYLQGGIPERADRTNVYDQRHPVSFVQHTDEETPFLTPAKLNPPCFRYRPEIDPSTHSIVIDYRYSNTSEGLQCEESGQKTAAVPSGAKLDLEVSGYGPYVGTIRIPKIAFSISGTCHAGGTQFPVSDVDDGLLVMIPISGSLPRPTGHGSKAIAIGVQHTWNWALVR